MRRQRVPAALGAENENGNDAELPNDTMEEELLEVDTPDVADPPPYEIWFYTSMPETRQANVRFLFYNPSLVRNDFRLLHSTANGEIQNPRWEVELYKDSTQEIPGVDESEMGDNVHRNARTYFEY